MQVILQTPLPHQIELLEDKHDRQLIVAGRRSGKSHFALNKCVIEALEGKNIWWVSPSHRQSEDLWKLLCETCADFKINRGDRTIDFPTGGRITVKSGESGDNLRGSPMKTHGIVVDEVAFISEQVYREKILPVLLDGKGWLTCISTPNGMNWFYDLCQVNKDNPRYLYKHFTTASTGLYTSEQLENMRKDMGDLAYRQEYQAEFVATQGSVFPSHYFNDVFLPQDYTFDHFATSAIGVDPATGKSLQACYSAIVFVGMKDGFCHVDCDMARRGTTELINAILRMRDEHRCPKVGIESNFQQTDILAEFNKICQEKNVMCPQLHAVWNKDKKEDRISALSSYLSRGQLKFRNTLANKELVNQLRQFPNGEFDDGADALAQAIRLLCNT